MEGWIKLHRDIRNHWVFHDAFALKAWLYILIEAAHDKYQVHCKGELVTLWSGQLIYGRPEWSDRLNIPEGKLRGVMDLFVQSGMVTLKPIGRRYTIMSVLNWDLYQREAIAKTETNRITNVETLKEKCLSDIDNQQNHQQRTNREPNNKNVKNEKNINNNISSKVFDDDSIPFKFALKLKNSILQNNEKARVPNEKGLQKWAADIDKMIRLDNRPEDEIERIIEFSQKDTFWQSNILSTAKLREKYDTLLLRSRNQGKTSALQPNQSKLPINMTNCKQREYDDEFYENLYENK